MCGRYTLTEITPDLLAEVFGVQETPQLSPRFNIAPTQNVPVVRVLEAGEPRRMDLLRWGLIPVWAKDRAIGNRLINARSETAAEKPAFRTSFKRKRCLVVTDGFYEWQKTPSGKQPFWIHREDSRPFAFAGLWSWWKDPETEEPVETFTILTTTPHPKVAPVHNRMPAIVAPEAYGLWLDPEEDQADHLQALLGPEGGKDLVLTPVSTRVNNPRNEGPENIEAVA
jgi:putative SOS response-associated peptidase YedK